MSDKITIIQFSLGAASFGINVHQTIEVERYVELSSLPRMPRFVAGFINLRGQIIIVMDLRKQLGLRINQPTSESRILIAEISKEPFGFIVDSVEDIKEVPRSEVRAAGDFALKVSDHLVVGVIVEENEWITILNFNTLIKESELKALRRLQDETKRRNTA